MSKARDIADLDFNSPDIDGGNIDGAVIGANTPAAGSFTAVSATSDITVGAGVKLKYNSDRYMTPENNVDGAEISANGVFKVKTGSTPEERFYINSFGNVGFGVTPATNISSTWQHIQFGGTGALIARHADNGVDSMFASNYYVNGSNVDSYLVNGTAARIFLNGSAISIQHAGSGTAGSAITWATPLAINSSGDATFTGNITINHDDADPYLIIDGSTGSRDSGIKINSGGGERQVIRQDVNNNLYLSNNAVHINSSGAMSVLGDVKSKSAIRVLEGSATAAGLFKEHDITGTGISNDLSIFAESVANGGEIHFMSGGSATKRMTISSTGAGTVRIFGPGNSVGGNLGLGNTGDGAAKWSYITGAHYNADTESEGIAMIGTYGSNGGNNVVIGGSIYEANPATSIQFYTHTSDTHNTGGTQKANINSAGDLTLNTGDLVIGTSGKGINFSATPNSLATAASETLSDYEEGTFTPVVGDGTYSYLNRRGHYVKIGNLVHIHIGFRLGTATSVGTAVGSISGLPFLATNYGAYREPHSRVSVGGALVTANLSTNLTFYMVNNGTTLYARTTANNADTPVSSSSIWQNGSFIKVHMFYTIS